MVSFIGAMYRSFLLKVLTSKEVTFNCDDMIRPMLSSIYSGKDIPPFRIAMDVAARSAQNELQQGHSAVLPQPTDRQEAPTRNVIIVDDVGLKEKIVANSKEDLYIFVYDTQGKYDDMVYHYNEYLADEEILTVCMNSTCYKFILNTMVQPNSTVSVEIKNVGKYWLRSLALVFLVIFQGLVHYVCSSVVEHSSKFDPVFTDFDIASSNIVKFKDLLKTPMPQCSICFEEFIPEDDVRVLDCKHYYHPACIDRWLIGHSKRCPCCRNNIEINEKV